MKALAGILGLTLLCVQAFAGSAYGQGIPLKGNIEMDSLNQNATRIARPPMTAPNFNYGRGGMDSAGGPLSGNAQNQGKDPLSGVLNDNDFQGQAPKFDDLGEEGKSREMLLAWERWHKQLSAAIYHRWSELASTPGQATVSITVTRDHQISARIINSNGGPDFNSGLMESIVGLNGNPGLTFPSGSQRTIVTYQADYIAGHNIQPGYTWVKNDYERVREN